MSFLYIFRDEQQEMVGAKALPIPFLNIHAHPSSPIKSNRQDGAVFLSECIPPPSEAAPLDITMVDSGNEIAHTFFYQVLSPHEIETEKSCVIHHHLYLPLSTIFSLNENNMKITQKVLCLGVLV